MYRALAKKITNHFIKRNIISDKEEDIYSYGFEIMISSFVYLLIFLAVAILSNTIIASFAFWIGLFLIRKTAGGHHANSYTSCHILFLFNHIAFVAIALLLPRSTYTFFNTTWLALSILLVFILAPVDHKNKPFINNEYKRFKLLSRLYCVVLLIIFIFECLNVIPQNKIILAFSFGTFSATCSLVSGKIIRKKERKSEQ